MYKFLIVLTALLNLSAFAFAVDSPVVLRSDSVVPKAVLNTSILSIGGKAPWTVMVYMNGKNDLEQSAISDFNEMEAVGSNKNVNIVVELGVRGTKKGAKGTVGRYYVRKDSNPKEITSLPVMKFQADMGDYRNVIAFVKWAKMLYPAQRYMLILWDHGTGWVDPKKGVKAISFDFEEGSFIQTTQMGKILRGTGNVDMYMSDACNMQMLEVLYEIGTKADVLLGSEAPLPVSGIDYTKFFRIFNSAYAQTNKALASALVAGFPISDRTGKMPIQLSAVASEDLPILGAYIDNWIVGVTAANDKACESQMVNDVQRFNMALMPYPGVSMYADLYDMVSKYLKCADKSSAAAKSSRALMKQLEKTVIANRYLPSKTEQGFHPYGVAITVPLNNGGLLADLTADSLSNNYSDLVFAKSTQWPKFLKRLENMQFE